MADFAFYFVLSVILTETLTEIVTSSALFEPLRARTAGNVFGTLISCGYCLSVWMGMFFAGVFNLHGQIKALPGIVEIAIWGFIIHRTSNGWHTLVTALRRIAMGISIRVLGT